MLAAPTGSTLLSALKQRWGEDLPLATLEGVRQTGEPSGWRPSAVRWRAAEVPCELIAEGPPNGGLLFPTPTSSTVEDGGNPVWSIADQVVSQTLL